MSDSKPTLGEWVALSESWQAACANFDAAKKERERIFKKAKTRLGCAESFDNQAVILEMLEVEVGKAYMKERKR